LTFCTKISAQKIPKNFLCILPVDKKVGRCYTIIVPRESGSASSGTPRQKKISEM
jgi:hypothetical protein